MQWAVEVHVRTLDDHSDILHVHQNNNLTFDVTNNYELFIISHLDQVEVSTGFKLSRDEVQKKS